MTYFPRVRPILGVSRLAGLSLAALLALIIGVFGGAFVAGMLR